jgi:hypothetical protein
LSKNNSHIALVNHRLNAARFFLSLKNNNENSLTPSQKKASLENALLQLYFALYHYLNELLSYYHKSNITSASLSLEHLLIDKEQLFLSVSEFNELQQWYYQRGSLLKILTQLPTSLILDNISETEAASKKNNQLIAVSLVAEDDGKEDDGREEGVSEVGVSGKRDGDDKLQKAEFTFTTTLALLNQLQQLIDRQRENQTEC